jgi:uncharacterized cupredoxin-like copper-binding protein
VPNRGAVALAAVALALGFPLGCGGSSDNGAGGTTTHVGERDFRIKSPAVVPAGNVSLDVNNTGPDDHELIIVRTTGALPLRGDGVTVDEDAVESRTVGALEPGLGARSLHIRLQPGTYEFICNMQGHYLAGMHRRVTVTG